MDINEEIRKHNEEIERLEKRVDFFLQIIFWLAWIGLVLLGAYIYFGVTS